MFNYVEKVKLQYTVFFWGGGEAGREKEALKEKEAWVEME